jgi:hypothetical protein
LVLASYRRLMDETAPAKRTRPSFRTAFANANLE